MLIRYKSPPKFSYAILISELYNKLAAKRKYEKLYEDRIKARKISIK